MTRPRPSDRPPPVPPAAALASLVPPDVDLEVGWRHDAARPVWHGVVWGRLGRGDLAAAHLDRVTLRELQPWIAAERGRLLRELGLHAAAESIEFPALVDATDPVDDAMLRLSLVADAVGLGDGDRARRRLAAAREAVGQLPDGPRAARQRLRWSWVELEVAFTTGGAVPDTAAALLPEWDAPRGAPVEVADLAYGSDFHRAKSWLFAAALHGDRRLLDAAWRLAPPVLAWAVALARADHGVSGALEQARAAWAAIVPLPGYERDVARTPVGRQLGESQDPADLG